MRYGKQIRRRYVRPHDPHTPAQLRSRARLSAASRKYSYFLTDKQQDACIPAGVSPDRRRLGTGAKRVRISGEFSPKPSPREPCFSPNRESWARKDARLPKAREPRCAALFLRRVKEQPGVGIGERFVDGDTHALARMPPVLFVVIVGRNRHHSDRDALSQRFLE